MQTDSTYTLPRKTFISKNRLIRTFRKSRNICTDQSMLPPKPSFITFEYISTFLNLHL